MAFKDNTFVNISFFQFKLHFPHTELQMLCLSNKALVAAHITMGTILYTLHNKTVCIKAVIHLKKKKIKDQPMSQGNQKKKTYLQQSSVEFWQASLVC